MGFQHFGLRFVIDAVIGDGSNVPWKISTLVSNIRFCSAVFSVCSFSWICRGANSVAHSLAKFAVSHPPSLHCNNFNLPPSVYEAWIRNLSCFSS
jgi:hypothetical protein